MDHASRTQESDSQATEFVAHGAAMSDYIEIEKPRPHTTVIRMNRPERMNSMAFEAMIPLHAAIAQVAEDNDTHCVVLTGTGRGFCSGADTQHTEPPPNIDGLTLTRIATKSMTILSDLVPALRRMPQPVICAINGAAIGGGLCLAAACDIRIASTAAYFRAAGINNGLTAAELGLSYILPRAIGASRAFEIMLSGRDVDAAEADHIGLVSRVVAPDALLDSCYELAERIAGYSHVGVELTKQLLWASLDAGGLHAHMNHEGHAQLYVRLTTENFEESVRARAEGRKPVYRDHRSYGHELEPGE
jgi:enoyl-CoA hydratase